MNVTIFCRSRNVLNPQRRDLYGYQVASDYLWSAWEALEYTTTEKAEARLKFWQELNDYAVSQRGDTAKREFKLEKQHE